MNKKIQRIQNIVITFNNHFVGFGFESANNFLKLMDKLEIDGWAKELKRMRKTIPFLWITNTKQAFLNLLISKHTN